MASMASPTRLHMPRRAKCGHVTKALTSSIRVSSNLNDVRRALWFKSNIGRGVHSFYFVHGYLFSYFLLPLFYFLSSYCYCLSNDCIIYSTLAPLE